MRYLQDHVKAVHEYVNVASQTVETSDVVAVETSHLLKDAVDDLDNVVAMLGTLADLTANSGRLTWDWVVLELAHWPLGDLNEILGTEFSI